MVLSKWNPGFWMAFMFWKRLWEIVLHHTHITFPFYQKLLEHPNNQPQLFSNRVRVLLYPNMIGVQILFLSQTFGCSVGNFPFTYLGLPLGLTKPKVEDFVPLVTRGERGLISTSNFLTQCGSRDENRSYMNKYSQMRIQIFIFFIGYRLEYE